MIGNFESTCRLDTDRRSRRSNSIAPSSSGSVKELMRKLTVVEGSDMKKFGASLREYRFTFKVRSWGIRGMRAVLIKPVDIK